MGQLYFLEKKRSTLVPNSWCTDARMAATDSSTIPGLMMAKTLRASTSSLRLTINQRGLSGTKSTKTIKATEGMETTPSIQRQASSPPMPCKA